MSLSEATEHLQWQSPDRPLRLQEEERMGPSLMVSLLVLCVQLTCELGQQ